MDIGKYVTAAWNYFAPAEDLVKETRARKAESRRFPDMRSKVIAEVRTSSGISAMARLYLKGDPVTVRDQQERKECLDVSVLEITGFIDGDRHQIYNVDDVVRQETANRLEQRYGVKTIWEDDNKILCSAGNREWLMYREGFAIGMQ